MITGECHYCRSQRRLALAPPQHEAGCPAYGRRPARVTVAEIELFAHPDVVELDLQMSAWYPSVA